MKNKILTLLLCVFVMPAQALQIHQAMDDELIKAKISAKETSRITVIGDRIKQFFVNQGRLVVEKDESKGDLYLTPTEFFKDKDISLFITSESGKTFSLSLTPTEMPSDTIAIKPSNHNNSVAQTWETETPYEEALIKLVKAMHQGEIPKGYQVNVVRASGFGVRGEKKKTYEIESATQYTGSQLQAYAVTVKNSSKEIIELKGSDFNDLHPLAIAIEQNKLCPTLKTRIFVVTRHG